MSNSEFFKLYKMTPRERLLQLHGAKESESKHFELVLEAFQALPDQLQILFVLEYNLAHRDGVTKEKFDEVAKFMKEREKFVIDTLREGVKKMFKESEDFARLQSTNPDVITDIRSFCAEQGRSAFGNKQ